METLWKLITDPDVLARLTPLVQSIEAEGDRWRWTLDGVDGLGVSIEAVFTERMEFTEMTQIVFTHDPPPAARERAAVEGVYDFEPNEDGTTNLRVDLTLSVDLPLPRLSRLAVERTMGAAMRLTGQRFATNLYEELGLDPTTVTIREGKS